jgi:hypothetical protein
MDCNLFGVVNRETMLRQERRRGDNRPVADMFVVDDVVLAFRYDLQQMMDFEDEDADIG